MIKAKFSSEMLSILKSTVGQSLLYYERAKEDDDRSTYGNLRLYFSKSVVDLENEVKEFSDVGEELSCFSCKLVTDGSPYKPFVITGTEAVQINAIVTGIEIISDEVTINNGEAVMDFDSALVFKTDAGDYVFARTEWFSELILLAHNERYDTLFPVRDVMESWENDGENQVKVVRSRNQL